MKRIVLFFLVIYGSCCISTKTQTVTSKGIQFFKGSWKELLDEAKKQQKLIFVDVYTDWCGPCKQMDRDIFPLPQVGDLYNKHFINYRLNAEKGEGIQLAGQYAVKSYPCYLFLDSAGNVLDRDGDYQSQVAFVALGKRALEKKIAGGNLDEFRERYEKGDRQSDFLKSYLAKRTNLGLDNSQLLNEYVKSLPESSFNNPEEIMFLSQNMGSAVSNALPILLSRLHLLTSSQKLEVTDRLYSRLLYYAFGNAIKDKRFDDADQHLEEIEAIIPFLSNKHLASIDNLKLRYFSDIKDAARLKFLGYSLANKQLEIPADTMVKKDLELFKLAMEPFLSGKMDSLKIPGFQEEKKFAARQYSQGVASLFYTISTAFLNVLAPEDKSLNDALIWANYTYSLAPNENTKALCDRLRERINGGRVPKDE
ncbi:MAG: thioredoxin family protein [Bacteroidia bacterium]